MKNFKRVAVVGAGFAGIISVKNLKEEESIEPICFEKSSKIGGTWCYREENDYGTASISSTTTINHSKELGALSDYPVPKEYPNYMRHEKIFRYFLDYAAHFDVLKHITCNREVVRVERSVDYEETGRWKVTVKNTETEELSTEIYDGVLVCAGEFGRPNMPSYPGMEKYQGTIMHSQTLKKFDKFSEQKVVVVGGGCSALDSATDISNVATQVYLSVRTPSWIMSRVGPLGLPTDYTFFRRIFFLVYNIAPIEWSSKFIQCFTFNHKNLGIFPKYSIMRRDPILNDAISAKLITGTVILKKDIEFIGKNGVMFKGEDKITDADAIVMATGYKHEFPFLEKGVFVDEGKGKVHLYKCVFPPHLKHPTLAFIAFVLPYGAGFPICEMQSRWVAHLLSGKGCLPSRCEMMKDIENRFTTNSKRYSPSDKMSVRIDFVPYMDELAIEIGAKPNFFKMLFTDPRLFYYCIFGAALPYQYRLVGPHKWSGAREAILSAPERVRFPLTGSKIVKKQKFNDTFALHVAICVLIALIFSRILNFFSTL